MGEANKRGTPEQRKAQGEKREFELNQKRKEHIAKLEQIEKDSERIRNETMKQIILSHLKYTDKYSLTQRQRGATMVAS